LKAAEKPVKNLLAGGPTFRLDQKQSKDLGKYLEYIEGFGKYVYDHQHYLSGKLGLKLHIESLASTTEEDYIKVLMDL
jgi:hypothetical protein